MSDDEPRGRSQLTSLAAIFDGRMQAFPAEHRGIPMRSQLEASFATHLDGLGVRWEYEPRHFTDRDGRGYLPDFLVNGNHYIEVKPTLAEVPLARKRMESIWRVDPTATLIVVCAEGCRFYAATIEGGEREWVERWRH